MISYLHSFTGLSLQERVSITVDIRAACALPLTHDGTCAWDPINSLPRLLATAPRLHA
jgi:hypothetical protein